MATLRVAIDASRARAGAAQARTALNTVGASAGQAGGRIRKFDASLAGVGRTAGLVSRQLRQLLGGFTAFIAIRSTINVLRSFGETMAFVRAIAIDVNDTLENQARTFARLEEVTRGLGATTRFTATQAAEGMLALSRAGFDANEAIAALPLTLSLATAGMLDLGSASDLVAVTLRQFGLEAGETERIADVLLNTANNSTTTVAELGESMKFAGAFAGQLGISLEETAAAMGVMANAGLRGSLAGTALRQILVGLIKPTKQARDQIAAMGLTMDDVNVRTLGVVEVFQRLAKAGAGPAQLARIFRVTAVTGAAALTSAADAFKNFSEEIVTVQGTAQRTADIVDDELNGAILQLKSAIESVQLSMTGFKETLRDVIDFATLVARTFDDISDSEQGVTRSAMLVGAAIRGIVAAVTVLLGLKLLVFFGKFNITLKAIFITLNANPFFALAAAIGIAVAALKAFENEIITVGGRQVRLGDVTQVVWKKIKEIFFFTIDFIGNGWEKLFKFMGAVIANFPQIVEAVGKGIANFFQDAYEKIGLNWKALWQTSIKIITIAANAIIATIDSIVAVFTGLIKRVNDFVTSFAKIDFSSPEALADSLLGIGDAFAQMLDPTNAAKDAIDAFARTFTEDPAGQFLAGIVDSLAAALESLDEFLGTIGVSVTGMSTAWKDIVSSIARAAAQLGAMRDSQRELGEFSAVDFLGGQEAIDSISDVARSMSRAASSARLAEAAFESEIATLERLGEEALLTANELELLALQEKVAENVAIAFGVGTDEAADAMARLAEELAKLQAARDLVAFAQEIGDAFGDSFEGMLDGFARVTRESENAGEAFKKFGEVAVQALEDFIRALIRAVIQQALIKPLSGAITGGILGLIGSAKGNVFQGGSLQTFASGGVVTSPTVFPMATGGIGLAGEAGPEGILPLKRGADGRLGVIAQGGGGGVTNITQNFVINTPDANSFRKSQAQIASGARRQLGRST